MHRFLTNDKKINEFQNKVMRVQRTITETPITSENLQLTSPQTSITTVVRDQFNELTQGKVQNKRGLYDIRCLVIRVEKDDGMTWAAEIVNEFINKQYPQIDKKVVCLQPSQTDNILDIAALSSNKYFRNYLSKNLLPNNKLNNKIFLIFIIALLYVIGDILKDIIVNPTFKLNDIFDIFINRYFWIAFIILIIIAFLIHFLSSRHKIDSATEPDIVLKEILFKLKKTDYENYKLLIEKLSIAINPSSFRIVIIDNYSLLDEISKDLIEYYLNNYEGTNASELWIVFENNALGSHNLMNYLLNNIDKWVVKYKSKAFVLDHITKDQKQKLIESLQLPEEASMFRLIKAICNNQAENNNYNIDQFKSYRKENPKRSNDYDELDIFFVLSLISSPVNMYFSQEYYFKLLTNTAFLKSAVLECILFSNKIHRKDIKDKLQHIFILAQISSGHNSFFSEYLEILDTNRLKKFSVIPEVKACLDYHNKILGLPNPGLCHLFWALFWGDNIKNVHEAVWLHKLCHHLKEYSSIHSLPEAIIGKIHERLFEIYKETIQGCLTTGLFNHLDNLFDDAIDLSKEKVFEGKNYANRLLPMCWNAFIITSDIKYLKFILNICLISDEKTEIKEINLSKEELHIFLEMLNIKDLVSYQSDMLDDLFVNMFINFSENERLPIVNYIKIRTYWIKIFLNPLAERLDYFIERTDQNFKYLFSSDITNAKLFEMLQEIKISIKNGNNNYIDFVSISDLIWCFALHLYNSSFNYNRYTENEINHEDTKIENFIIELLDEFLDISILLTKVHTDVVNHKLLYSDNSYLIKSLIFDTLINIVISVQLIIHSFSIRFQQNTKISVLIVNVYNSIIKEANNITSFKIKDNCQNLNDYLEDNFTNKLISLIKLGEITWKSLDLVSLFEKLDLKRIHYKLSMRQYTNIENLIKENNEIAKLKDINGIMSNLLVCFAGNKSVEIESFYFNATMDIITELGAIKLKSEFMLLQMFVYNRVQIEGLDLSKDILNYYKSGDFESFINTLKPESIISVLLMWKIFSDDYIKNPEVRNVLDEGIKKVIQKKAYLLNDEDILACLKADEIRKDIVKSDNLDYLEIINSWGFSKVSAFYSSILYTLINKGIINEIESEYINLLKTNLDNFKYNSFLFLAIKVVNYIKNDELKSDITHYIENALQRFENNQESETNIKIYRDLKKLNPIKKTFYDGKIQFWLNCKAHVYDLKMKYYMKSRKYFDLFKFCYDLFENFGLKCDVEQEVLEAKIKLSESEIKYYLNGLITNRIPFPEPFIEKDGTTVISSDFLICGHFLFESNIGDVLDVRLLQNKLNTIAEKNMRYNFELIIKLQEIPSNFKNIMIEYINRFEYYTTPEEMEKV